MSMPEKSDYSPPTSPSVDAVVPALQGAVVQDQPAAVEKMVVAGASPRNALNVAVNTVTGKRDWSYGLFDCFSACGTTCMAMYCGACLFGQTQSKLKALVDSTGPVEGTMLNADCFRMVAWSWCGCACIPLAQEREALQRRYNIEGSGGNNLVATICCSGCVQVQHSREIEEEERFLKGHSH